LGVRNIDLDIVTDLQIFSTSIKKKWLWGGVCLSVCSSAHARASLVSERWDGFYSYSVFKSLFILGWCQVNLDIRTPKGGHITPALKTKRQFSRKTTMKTMNKLQQFIQTFPPEYC
jgi:hypothetical protein